MAAAVDTQDQWHWQEVDLVDWLKRWLTLNINQAVLVDTSTHFVRCREAYKDTGECLVHCRKGQFFATCACSYEHVPVNYECERSLVMSVRAF